MTGFREALIDLAAITANVRHLRAQIGTPHTMAVVKANGYGHGAIPAARAALAGGADWLGVADIGEGLELRSAGLTAPILAWLHAPEPDFAGAVAADIDLGVSSARQLQQAADAARAAGRVASVHVKLDTGLSRNGVPEAEWSEVFALAAALEQGGALRVRGMFSHLSNASPEDDAAAIARFGRGLAGAAAAGLAPELIHLAATAAALRLPAARYTMVRLGIGIYGLSPFDDATSADLGLVPAMTLQGQLASVRRVPAGAGVSYDYTWRADADTTLGLVPFGYADGIPRQASGHAQVALDSGCHPAVGRIAMDQFVVNLGGTKARVGDHVVVFGDPTTGVPSATDWARAAGTINYDVVTGIGNRVERRYTGSADGC